MCVCVIYYMHTGGARQLHAAQRCLKDRYSLYMLYLCQSADTDASRIALDAQNARVALVVKKRYKKSRFTCFTGAKVQILTLGWL